LKTNSLTSRNGDRLDAKETVDHIEELTLRLEAIDLSTDIETARCRLEEARCDPERPTAEEVSGKLDLSSLPWLLREDSSGGGPAA